MAAVQQALKPAIHHQKTHASTAEEADVEAGEADVIKLFFVRVPRPANVNDDAHVKQLQEAFQVQVEAVKTINSKLGAKRDALRALRGQRSEARALRDTTKPEFDDKLNRLKQLRELANGHKASISEIKGLTKGLDCKTERELDARIKQEEEKIRLGAVSLREEKLVVNEIGKLRSQREHVKQYEQQKSSLEELESEMARVKAVIVELDAEFSVIKGERDAAAKVATDLNTQVEAMDKDFRALEERQKEVVEKKNAALAKLEAAKGEREGSSQEYRENRKFSLLIREMVDRGELDAARDMCAKQVDTLVAQLASDSTFRAAYSKGVAEQRKQVVSILLPESSASAAAAAAVTAAAAPPPPAKAAGAGKAAAAPAPALKPVARGAEKAKDLIASLMQQATAEAALVRASQVDEDSDGNEEPARAEEAPRALPAAKPAAPAAAPKFVENPAAKAAEVFHFKPEVVEFEETEFVPPPRTAEVEPMSKEEVREVQRHKALDAEVRKKKRQDTNTKKKAKAVLMQKKAEEEPKVEEAVQPELQAEPALGGDVEAAKEPEVAAADPAPVKAKAKQPTVPQLTAAAKLVPPAAKRPATKASVLRTLKMFYQDNQILIVLAAVVALILAMLML